MDHTSIPTRRWITWSRDAAERAQVAQDDFDFVMDVDDDEILACGIENPDVCESCQ